MRSKRSPVRCDVCGRHSGLVRKISRTYGRGKDLLIIEKVPVVHCTQCGESYLTAETLGKIERIKLHRAQVAVSRPVAVARF